MSMLFFLTAAHFEGRAAYRAGEPSDTNPYSPDCLQYSSWRDGWIAESLSEDYTPETA